MAETKGTKISSLLKRLVLSVGNEVNRLLFRYQVKHGLILCVVGEEDHGETHSDSMLEVETETEETESEEVETEGEEAKAEEDDDEVSVSIEGETPSPDENIPAPDWVKELRKTHRETLKRNRELEEKLKAVASKETQPVETGKKPTLEACDYDAEEFEQQLEAWHSRKIAADAEERKKQEQAEKANRAWQETLDGYGKAKTELKVKDFEEAEDVVKDVLNVTQQGIILQGSKNPALLVYALGKNPKKAKELSSINDPVKFAFAVANLENQLKVTSKKAPPPEKAVRGSAAVSGTVDSTLERLRDEAAKSGDMSKVVAYKNQQRAKAR